MGVCRLFVNHVSWEMSMIRHNYKLEILIQYFSSHKKHGFQIVRYDRWRNRILIRVSGAIFSNSDEALRAGMKSQIAIRKVINKHICAGAYGKRGITA